MHQAQLEFFMNSFVIIFMKKWYQFQEVSILKRFYSQVLDLLIISLFVTMVYFLLQDIKVQLNEDEIKLICIPLFLVLFLSKDVLLGNQSIGKWVFIYKVIPDFGMSNKITLKQSVLRNISLLFPFIDIYFLLIGKKRLGDRWAKTHVTYKYLYIPY